jgi:transcription elongation factor GreA
MVNGLRVGDAVARYLASVPEEGRRPAQQELQRFLLWCGRDKTVESLTPRDIGRYAENARDNQLEPLRTFLASLSKQKLTNEDLSKAIRARRPTTGRATTRTATVTAQRPPRQTPRLTSEGHAQLQAELESLIAERPKVAEELRKALADGDISENAPLDAMRDYQGQLEARIRELEALLRSARVVENGVSELVGQGSNVLLRDLSSGETLRYFLVDPAEANPRQGKLSVTSPLGQALIGRGVGEEVEVAAPAGTWRYRIEPSQ